MENQDNQRSYIYATAANGMEVRIPADKYDSWKEAQDRIRRGENIVSEETVKKLSDYMKGDRKTETKEKNKGEEIMNILTSKRIAAVISIFLCISLYFSLLSAVFTKKVDTFIAYTQEGQTVLHGSITCKTNTSEFGYHHVDTLDFSKPIITTTNYEHQDYTICRSCVTSAVETTITVKNYVTPLIISIVVSLSAFFILTFKKKYF